MCHSQEAVVSPRKPTDTRGAGNLRLAALGVSYSSSYCSWGAHIHTTDILQSFKHSRILHCLKNTRLLKTDNVLYQLQFVLDELSKFVLQSVLLFFTLSCELQLPSVHWTHHRSLCTTELH